MLFRGDDEGRQREMKKRDGEQKGLSDGKGSERWRKGAVICCSPFETGDGLEENREEELKRQREADARTLVGARGGRLETL